MKILLVAINAKYIHSNLAVYSLQAYAKEYSEHISIIEMTVNNLEEDILREIYKEKADVIAFSCYIWNISLIKRIAAELKKVLPSAALWFGGPEVSYHPEQLLKEHDCLDGIIIGEGEQTFLELVQHFVNGNRALKDIKGIAYREKDETQSDQTNILVTPAREALMLDSIPFPYGNMEPFRNKIIYYESSRGCPFSCSYCLSSIDRGVRLRSAELVKQELKQLLDYQVPQVKFVDRTFNCNKKHAMEIWTFIKEHDNGITNFHFEISADLLSDEEIEFLAGLRPGQVQFEIGVQSTNPDTVKAIHRKMDFHKLSKNVAAIKKGDNIHQHLDLIAGLPLEGYDSFEKSFNDVYGLKPEQLQLGFLKVLKGSMIEAEQERYKIIYRNTAPYEVLSTEHLSYDELLRIKGICEMLEVYYNSGQFAYSISFLESCYSSPFRLYSEISDFYEVKGYSLVSHSRVKRYEILLDFYIQVVLESKSEGDRSAELFSELLLLDYLLKEPYKTRPSFARVKEQGSNLRQLYERYKGMHKLLHIEEFAYDLFASASKGAVVEGQTRILFDYSSRDPLNHRAKLTILEE